MNKYFCDICGKELPAYNKKYRCNFELLSIPAFSIATYPEDEFLYDFCDDCKNKLMEFLKRRNSI